MVVCVFLFLVLCLQMILSGKSVSFICSCFVFEPSCAVVFFSTFNRPSLCVQS